MKKPIRRVFTKRQIFGMMDEYCYDGIHRKMKIMFGWSKDDFRFFARYVTFV